MDDLKAANSSVEEEETDDNLVIDNNEKFSGCTVHFVNSKLDSGKIILQKKVKVLKSESRKSLEKKVLKIEHEIYPKAIIRLLTSY